jgi:hypothetical protein
MIRVWLIPLAIFACAALSGCGRSERSLGVCITGALNIKGAAPGRCLKPGELNRLTNLPVLMGAHEEAKLTLSPPGPQGHPQTAADCAQYRDLKAKNYFALTTMDMATQGWFERACATVSLLERAQRAKHSYLDSPNNGLADPKWLPAAMLPEPPGGGPAPSGTIGDLVASGAVKIQSAARRRLDLDYKGERAVYEELARGDFDGDGVEDMLVFESTQAIGGTMVGSSDLILTRKFKGAPLTLLPAPKL